MCAKGNRDPLVLTALLRKSDSFRSPKSRKLDPGNSLSAGKGSKTASIAPGSRRPPFGLRFPHSRAAAIPAQSCGWAGQAARGAGPGEPRGRSGGGGAGWGRWGTLRQQRRTHRGHSADSSSSSSRGAAGFHGDPGGGADAGGAPRAGWEPGVGELNAPPRLDGCRISLGFVLGTASVTFPGLKPGTLGWLVQLARVPRPHINIHDNSILMSGGVAGASAPLF